MSRIWHNKRAIIRRYNTSESVEPRQIAMFYLNKTTGYSLAAIGKIFNRHYATVIYAVKKVPELAFTERLYFERIKVLGLDSYLKE